MIRLLTPADIISSLNALFGFLSIVILTLINLNPELRYRLSLLFIFLALLADGLDGLIARKTRKGPLGPYLESIADFTSTGIATSMFLFHLMYEQITNQSVLIFIVAGLLFYLFCVLVRLAAFHPLKTTDHFRGVPAPAAALLLVVIAYLGISFVYMIPVIIGIAVLMVSPISYMKPGIKMNIGIAMTIILVIIVDTLWNSLVLWLFLILMILYIFVSPIISKLR